MKSKNKVNVVCLLMVSLCLFACSEQNDKDENILENGIPVTVRLDTKALPDNLLCNLYVFGSISGADYLLKEVVELGNQDKYSLKFKNIDLSSTDYKFLFVATTDDNQEINLHVSNNDLAIGDKWSDVRLTALTKNLSDNYYYGVVNKTGAEILDGQSIDAVLNRVMGQMVFEIFRIDGNGQDTSIVSSAVSSVLDRVYQIDIEYSNITDEVSFSNAGNLIVEDKWEKFTQTINVTMGNDLRVTIPQELNSLVSFDSNVKGSVRINGYYCLPSERDIRLKLTFYYYDTTPVCGSEHTVHTSDCFVKRTLVLHLPEESEATNLLSIRPDYYTKNRAGIRYDRIIDIGVDGFVTFDVVWE